jgi:hypothetical protein
MVRQEVRILLHQKVRNLDIANPLVVRQEVRILLHQKARNLGIANPLVVRPEVLILHQEKPLSQAIVSLLGIIIEVRALVVPLAEGVLLQVLDPKKDNPFIYN